MINLPLIPQKSSATCFAPSNIALIKYWGKRDLSLNLPNTSSLSISLGNLGTRTTLRIHDKPHDKIFLNGATCDQAFHQRLVNYFNRFRPQRQIFFEVDTHNNIPTAAGLASSASGFAALVMAMNELFAWKLSLTEQSILARLGSGSACRSFWQGFVEWHCGTEADGSDSFAEPLAHTWDDLCIGLLILSDQPKALSSTTAMLRTTQTSRLYQDWPAQVEHDLKAIKQAISQQDFIRLGEISETNALAMHATMLDSDPAIDYCTPETYHQRQKVRNLRQQDIPVYFTQDAGPNLKLLFEAKHAEIIKQYFPSIIIS